MHYFQRTILPRFVLVVAECRQCTLFVDGAIETKFGSVASSFDRLVLQRRNRNRLFSSPVATSKNNKHRLP
jgi:hypothetical protein